MGDSPAERAQRLLEGATTPGPWVALERDGMWGVNGIRENDGTIVYQIDTDNGHPLGGDAHLIAAAPDLARYVLALSAERDEARAERDDLDELCTKRWLELAKARAENEVLRDALQQIAAARQEADDFDHPNFDWRLLARKMESVARRALTDG